MLKTVDNSVDMCIRDSLWLLSKYQTLLVKNQKNGFI